MLPNLSILFRRTGVVFSILMTPYILLPLFGKAEIVLQLLIDQLQVEEHEVRAEFFKDQCIGLSAGFGREEGNGVIGFLAAFLGGRSFETL